MNIQQLNRLDGISKMYTDEKIIDATASVYEYIGDATASVYEYIGDATASVYNYIDNIDLSNNNLQKSYLNGNTIMVSYSIPVIITNTYSTTFSVFKVGNTYSYTEFENDGTLHMVGTSSVWNDMMCPLLTCHPDDTFPPTIFIFMENCRAYSFEIDTMIYGTAEISHDYKVDSNIEVHIHWCTTGVDDNTRGVKWEFKYSIGDVNDVFDSEKTYTIDEVIPGNTATYSHYKSKFDKTLSGKVGTIIMWRLMRITSAEAAPTHDPFGLCLGFHYETDTIGSRSMYIK